MSTHFCRVGKIKPNLNKILSLKEFENRVANFVQDVNKFDKPKDWDASF